VTPDLTTWPHHVRQQVLDRIAAGDNPPEAMRSVAILTSTPCRMLPDDVHR